MKYTFNRIITIFVSIVFVFLFLCLLYYIILFLNFDRNNYNNDKYWVNCIGTLIEANNCAECASKFEYSYNNVKYEEYSYMGIKTQILGSKYIIKVNPKMPKKYIPLEWKPIFTSDEKTHLTKGVTKKISGSFFVLSTGISTDSLSNEYIVFEYKIDDEKLERKQYLSPQYKTQFPNLGIGQTYLVEYWDEDVERAIIYFDKPVIDTINININK